MGPPGLLVDSLGGCELDVVAWINDSLRDVAHGTGESVLQAAKPTPAAIQPGQEEESGSKGDGEIDDSAEGRATEGKDAGPNAAGAQVEANISSLLLRLQQDAHSLNVKLEEEMSRLLSSIPRALREVERVGRETEMLGTSLRSLAENVDQVSGDSSNGTTINTLEHLHIMKTNLDKSLSVLEKTAAWDRLLQEVEASFVSRDLGAVAERLGSLRESLELLKGMPHSDKRADTLHKMEQRLETLIGPGLRRVIAACLEADSASKESESTSIETVNSALEEPLPASGSPPEKASLRSAEEELGTFVNIFEKLGRLDHLYKDFAEARAVGIREDWEEMQQSEERSFKDWVSRFFERLVGALEREKSRCQRLFGPKAGEVLNSVAVESLLLISPSFAEELAKLHVNDVMDTYAKSRNFSDVAFDMVCKLRAQCDSDAPFHMGSSDSLSESEFATDTVPQIAIARAVLEPYQEFLQNYGSMVRDLLIKDFENQCGQLSAQSVASVLSDTASIDLVQDAISRCISWSEGVRLPDVLGAIDEFWAEIASRCIAIINPPIKEDLSDASQASERMQLAFRHLQAIAGFADRVADFKQGQLAHMVADVALQLARHPSEGSQALATRGSQHLLLLLRKQFPNRELFEQFEENPKTAMESALLTESTTTIEKLLREAQCKLFDTMLGPVFKEWEAMSKFSIWAAETDAESKALGTGAEDKMSEFGATLPYMTRVTDYLIYTLVQGLEQFASKEPSPNLLPNTSWLGVEHREAVEELLQLEPGFRLTSVSIQPALSDSMDETDEEPDLLTPQWLAVAATGAVNSLAVHVLRMDKLGAKGVQQLVSDLNCFDNILGYISPQDPLLHQLRADLSKSMEELEESTPVASDTQNPFDRIQSLVLKQKKRATQAQAVQGAPDKMSAPTSGQEAPGSSTQASS